MKLRLSSTVVHILKSHLLSKFSIYKEENNTTLGLARKEGSALVNFSVSPKTGIQKVPRISLYFFLKLASTS